MNIKIDDRIITCDLPLALKIFCKDVEFYQFIDNRRNFIKQLFDIKEVYSGGSSKQYILKAHINGLLDSLSPEDTKNLKNLLLYHFSGSWGGNIKIVNNSTIKATGYND